MTWLRPRDGWLAAFAALLFFSFPQRFGALVIDFGWVTSWFAPACLVLGLGGLAPRAASRRALLVGCVAYAAILYWFYVVTVVYGHAPALAGVGASIGSGFGMACFLALFAAGFRWLCARGLGTPLAAASLWTSLEHLRSVFPLSGFPWATLGYAQHENGPLLGLATLTGVYGLSFVTVLGGVGLAAFYEWAAGYARGVRFPRLDVSAWIALGGVIALAGVGQLSRPEVSRAGPVLRVAALQGNIDQGVKWSREWADRILSNYEELSRRAAALGAEVIVWPETALPGSIELDGALERRLSRLARETGSVLVVGGVGVSSSADDDRTHYYDSAFVIQPSGARTDRYDKTHLVPFGEYVPLRWMLGGFLDAIASGIAPGDVMAGERPRSVDLKTGGASASVRAGVPICYELLFPDLVRRFAGDGAQLLLAITNDAWYGRTGAPHQFLAMTALRSAETGLWTVRAANTGVSAIIDAGGRVRERTGIFERDLLVADVPLHSSGEASTFYVRYGDVFAIAGWGVLLVHGLIAGLRSGGPPAPDERMDRE